MKRFFTHDTRGSTAVEFAFIAPIFILLVVAAILFGQAYYALGSVQWAIERTARDLMVDGELTEAEFETRVRQLTDSLTAMNYTVAYQDVMYGEIRVTEITTTLQYTINVPVVGSYTLTYPVEVHSPRPVV
ncbi:pilus assembly protein [Maricaulaceae bacterium EIL42A08]|nr:pilus assembly protein [Maricaulaceae bacterium EIL42A08]